MPIKRQAAKSRNKKPAGRQDNDIWIRLRALLWYHMVRLFTSDTDAELDEKFVQKDLDDNPRGLERTRSFERIRKFGVDPDWHGTGKSKKHPRREFSLIVRLAKEGFDAATEIGTTLLWRLLKKTPPTRDDIDEIIATALKKYRLFRAPGAPPESWPLELQSNNAFSMYPSKHYIQAINTLAKDPAPDKIALLGALYLEAMNETELDVAMLLRDLIRRMVRQYIEKYSISGLPKVLLIGLIEERLLKRRWAVVIPRSRKRLLQERLASNAKFLRQPARKITSFEHVVTHFLLVKPVKGSHLFPIVPMAGPLKRVTPKSAAYKTLQSEAVRETWDIPATDHNGQSFFLEADAALQDFFNAPPTLRAKRKSKRKSREDVLSR